MSLTRRSVIASAAALSLCPKAFGKLAPNPNLKTGKALPPIGMGTWLTFDIPTASAKMDERHAVLEAFFGAGGGMIDSSPMYGRAETIIGQLMDRFDTSQPLISATKIWTPLAKDRPRQIETSQNLWNLQSLDLVYVHNLLRWEPHLKTLRAAKDAGHVHNIGLTTSHGRRHGKLEQLMAAEPMDAVQFTYNILNREVENRLLPAAGDNGLIVVVNRPLMGGKLFDRVRQQSLPGFAADIGIQSWSEYFLKFVVSHPHVTCAIPATRKPDHMRENMRAANGVIPDAKTRRKMIAFVEGL